MSAATGYSHISVLLNEALDGLAIQADGLYIDGTFGRGGHSRALLAQLGPEGRLIAFDKDPEAIRVGDQLAAEDGRFVVVQRSFAEMADELRARGLAGQVQGVLLDLGVSSPQLDDPTRGFSFLNDGPLDMRMILPQARALPTGSTAPARRILRRYSRSTVKSALPNAWPAPWWPVVPSSRSPALPTWLP